MGQELVVVGDDEQEAWGEKVGELLTVICAVPPDGRSAITETKLGHFPFSFSTSP